MRIATIGAGWAGCAAAVTLARLGHPVTVFEAGATPGGRARRVVRDGLQLDNGQHLLLGAYEQTRNLLAVVHGNDGERELRRLPLVVAPAPALAHAFAMRARVVGPGPLGLAAGLLSAKGLSWSDRIGAAAWFLRLRARGFRCEPGQTVQQLCATGPRAVAEALWHPLCLAALNTLPQEACAQVFANVLRAALAGAGDASNFLLPATDLSALFPEPALAFVAAQGGTVRMRRHARIVDAGDHGVTIDSAGERDAFDAVVVAVGPHQLAPVLGDHPSFAGTLARARGLAYEPIATAWLGYSERMALPAPIVRLDDAPGQWVLDRPDVLNRAAPSPQRPALGQLLGVVISARGPHEALGPVALAGACDAQLRRLVPGLGALAWSQTIVEQRATYACTPGRMQAPSVLPHPRVALAGDWLNAEFPATLEAAVKSGVASAFALVASSERQRGWR